MPKSDTSKAKEGQKEAEKDLLTTKAAAEYLEFSRRTFDKVKAEDLAFPKPLPWGKSFRYHRDDLKAWKDTRIARLRAQNAARLAQAKDGTL